MHKQILVAIATIGFVTAVVGQTQAPLPGTGSSAPNTSSSALNNLDSKLDVHIGGGPATPVGTTSNFAGLNGNVQVGAGYKFNRHSSIVGEFFWQGLPPNRKAIVQILQAGVTPNLQLHTSSNVYAMTAEYMYRREGTRFGYYGIGGGGWYDRYSQLKNYTIAPGTVCTSYWDWWGFQCATGLVPTDNVLATKGVNSIGVNVGGGLTIRLGDSGLKVYIESRYHYAPSNRLSTQMVPVTFGFRW